MTQYTRARTGLARTGLARTGIPREERAVRGQTELRCRLDATLTVQLALVLGRSGETQREWVLRKITEDFAALPEKIRNRLPKP